MLTFPFYFLLFLLPHIAAGQAAAGGGRLSQWHTCASTSDRLTRHPDLTFDVPTSCVFEKVCAATCSTPGGACATVCGSPYTGGACACSQAVGCGANCQGCNECANCCCQSAKHHVLVVDTTSIFQTMEGFGGAFTEAAALNFFSLSESDQSLVLDAYYGAPFGEDSGSGGHGYQLGRIPINSCDFSPSQFSYDDVPGDGPSLPHFDHTVAHDAKHVIPFVLKAQARAAQENNSVLRLFGSPWSPPAWMKNPGGNRPSNLSMSGSNGEQGLATHQQNAWANYLSDWVSGFKAHGINIWGITVQNEAEFAAPWEACVYTAEFQAQFIGHHLGPTMAKNHPGLKIMAYDHNKDHVALWAKVLASDTGPTGAMQYLSGVAFHWYVNGAGCTIGTGDCMAEGAANLMEAYNLLNNNVTVYHADGGSSVASPFLLASESCSCPGVADDTPAPLENVGKGWQRGERLMRDSLSDLNHMSIGYVDWNLLVDYTGGPNHLGNNCDANIVADPYRKLTNKTSGAGSSAVVLRPSYYMLGHIARFAQRGSVRLGASFQVIGGMGKGADTVDVTAFTMPNGSTSVILLNRGEQAVQYTLRDKATGREAELTALAHSAQSYIY